MPRNWGAIRASSVASLRRSASIAPQFLSMMTVLTDTSSPELQYSTSIYILKYYSLLSPLTSLCWRHRRKNKGKSLDYRIKIFKRKTIWEIIFRFELGVCLSIMAIRIWKKISNDAKYFFQPFLSFCQLRKPWGVVANSNKKGVEIDISFALTWQD